jgi:hypothetical protein
MYHPLIFAIIYGAYIKMGQRVVKRKENIRALYLFYKYICNRYTHYVWTYLFLFWLLPNHWQKHSFWFLHNTTFGLFFGIEWIWYVDQYKSLFEIGERITNNRFLIISGDLLLHLTPLLLTYYWWYLNKKTKMIIPYGSGLVTGMMNMMYCYFIKGDLDPTTLYDISPREKYIINKGWTGLVASHFIGEFVGRRLTYESN